MCHDSVIINYIVSSLIVALFKDYFVPNFLFQDDDSHDFDGCQT